MEATRIYVIGASEVGKTALVNRYVQNDFTENYTTQVERTLEHQVTMDNMAVLVHLVDTAGPEDWSTKYIEDNYLHPSTGDCYLFCFDMSSKKSFEFLVPLVEKLYAGLKSKCRSQAPFHVALAGCKADLSEVDVSPQEIQELAQLYSISYFQTSAKNDDSVNDAFEWLLQLCLSYQKAAVEKSKHEATNLSLVDACACSAVFPKAIKKKLKLTKTKSSDKLNTFVMGRTPLQAALGRPAGPMRRQVIQTLLTSGADPFLYPNDKEEGTSVVSWLIDNANAQGLEDLLLCGVSESQFLSHKIQGKDIVELVLDTLQEYPPAIIHLIIRRVTESARMAGKVCNRIARNDFAYDPQDKLGAGGFGCVYSGTYQGQPAAIKLVDESLHPENSAFDLTSLRRELAILSLIQGDNLLQYHGYCYEEPHYFIVTELATHSLKGYLEAGLLGPSDWNMKAKIAMDVCRGMLALHNCGIAHRDLKTENILLFAGEDGKLTAKVADFGISRAVSSGASPQTRSVGTSNYMAPELLDRPEVLANEQLLKSDVYAFGYLLYVLCSGKEPHQGQTCASVLRSLDASKKKSFFGKYQTPLKIPASCPRLWKKLIVSCWQYEPSNRPTFDVVLSLLRADTQKVRKKKTMALSQDGVVGDKTKKDSKMRTSESAPGATISNQLYEQENTPDSVDRQSTLSTAPSVSRDSSSSSLYESMHSQSSHSHHSTTKKAKGNEGSKMSLRGPKLRRKRSHERPGMPDPVTLVRRPSIMDHNSLVRSPSFPPPRVLLTQDSDSDLTSSQYTSSTSHYEWTYPGQEDVDAWLDANGFTRYKFMFFDHEINMESIHELTREDLKDMGIWKVGVILNILRAASQSRRLYQS